MPSPGDRTGGAFSGSTASLEIFRFRPMQFDPYTASGLLGTACFVVSYFGTLQGWLSPTGWRFPAINLAGAMLVLVSLIDAWNLPSVLLECFWGSISIYGLVRSLRRRQPAPHVDAGRET